MTKLRLLKKLARRNGFRVSIDKETTCVSVYGDNSFCCTALTETRKQNIRACLNFIREVTAPRPKPANPACWGCYPSSDCWGCSL